MREFKHITPEEIEEFKKEMSPEELEGYLDTQEWARGVMKAVKKEFEDEDPIMTPEQEEALRRGIIIEDAPKYGVSSS